MYSHSLQLDSCKQSVSNKNTLLFQHKRKIKYLDSAYVFEQKKTESCENERKETKNERDGLLDENLELKQDKQRLKKWIARVVIVAAVEGVVIVLLLN